MKVELELPEVAGYEYTGEYRPFAVGEFYYNENEVHKATWSSSSCYPIMKAIKRKEKPKIVIYSWLVSGDVGYTNIVATEDFIVDVCKRAGWTYKKFNPSPLWSLDGDTL